MGCLGLLIHQVLGPLYLQVKQLLNQIARIFAHPTPYQFLSTAFLVSHYFPNMNLSLNIDRFFIVLFYHLASYF